MASLFISYSRRNIDAARRLTGCFDGEKLDFWIDWESIEPTLDWWREIQQGIEQEFVGIGIIVEGPPEKAELRVVSPVYDSPAHRAGMRAGDVILEIDGVSARSLELNQAVTRMKGLPGTNVTLLIQHVRSGEVFWRSGVAWCIKPSVSGII